MNKFKLALLSIISASLVGCGGGGGGGGTGTDTFTTVQQDRDGARVVADSGTYPTQVYQPNTQEIEGGGRLFYNTLSVLPMDLNGDGALDIVKFRSQGYDKLFIEAHINNGDGTSFKDESSFYFGKVGNYFNWVHDSFAVDLNDDNRLDIVMLQTSCFDDKWGTPGADYDECTTPLFQQADGSFTVNTNPLLQTATDGELIPADFDGDGDIDLLHRHLRTDNGGWGGKWHGRNVFDVFENRSENGVSKYVHHEDVFRNTPTGVGDLYGAFAPATTTVDINGDGRLDVIVGGARWGEGGAENDWFTQTTSKSSVYLNNGNMTFTYSKNSWLNDEATSISFYRHHAADFDGDGDMDIFGAATGKDYGEFAGEPNFMLWNSNGKLYQDFGTKNSWGYDGFTHSSAIGDIDNDGDIDVVVADLNGADIKYVREDGGTQFVGYFIHTNDGSGNFATTRIDPLAKWINHSDYGWWTLDIYLADMNGDGYLDIVTGENTTYGIDKVIFNKGNGTFDYDAPVYVEDLTKW